MNHTTTQLLEQLRALDVRLRLEDGRLRVNAPKGSLTPALEAALVEHKAALVDLLQGQSADRTALVPVDRAGPLRLSYMQERLWMLAQIQPADTAYNLAVCTAVIADADLDTIRQAIRRVVDRHEILRSRFVSDGAQPGVQIVESALTPVVVRDLRVLAPEARFDAVREAVDGATHEPFDLGAEAPVRFIILQTDDSAAAVLISAHHIAVDAWSLGVLHQELLREVAAVRAHEPPRPAQAVQYVDFAHWQRARTTGAGAADRMRYWTERLKSLPQLSSFPSDFPRPTETIGGGGVHLFQWPPSFYDGVRAMARELDATVYMVMLAAMASLLSRHSGQTDLAIGSPIGSRDQKELEHVIGPILNPLVLRFGFAEDPSFADVVRAARDSVLDGHAYQDVPFEALVQALNPHRSLGHSPLFQVAVVLHNVPEAGRLPIFGGGSIYDLTFFAHEHNGVLNGSFEYRTDLYEAGTIERLAEQLQVFLSGALRDPKRRVSTIPLLSDAESEALRARVNPVPVPVEPATVVEQFARNVRAMPLHTAVVASDGELTIGELDRRSSAVAAALIAAGAGRGVFVALATDRSSAMLVGMLGILKAGAAYVPIDVTYPRDRVAFMLEDCEAQHLVTTDDALRALSGIALPATVVRADVVPDDPTAAMPAMTAAAGPDDIAYMIYTSGSTGRPKGVRIPHRALTNFVAAMRVQPGLTSDDTVLLITSLSFDMSVLELFLPLVVGARMVIEPRETAADGARLASRIRSAGITLMQATPSGWRMLMHTGWEGEPNLTAVTGGETLPRDLADWLCPRVGRLVNAYGPTETTCWSSLAPVVTGGPITVGTPVLNTQIHVLDGGGNLAPVGAVGEICIGGQGVADGYHRRPELTAERFVPDPFAPGHRMYRTGDLGRWRTDGRLDHLGRADGQVKVRGHRIETGEIEAALVSHSEVKSAVVGVRSTSADDTRLIAWVQLVKDGDCTVSELRRHVRQVLPEFMIPAMITFVDAFPMTPSGKVDRQALPDPFASVAVAPREYVAPSTPTELMIAEVWTRLLGIARVGVTDSFFELGGHSLLAMRAASEISSRTGHEIGPRLLFFRTLGQLAATCDGTLAEPARAVGNS
ncbi:MAG: amino acid adenylation domain-containing protein [Gemmatimonadaceae bacterium]|nr:amino acid adenylation domain-containing protein [Gemmatimonadaceae bacterium]